MIAAQGKISQTNGMIASYQKRAFDHSNARIRAESIAFERGQEINRLRACIDSLNAKLTDQENKVSDFQRTALHYMQEAEKWKVIAGGADYEVPEMAHKQPVDEIVKEVLSVQSEYTVRDILSARRSRDLVRLRQECFYEVFRRRPDMSYPAIGRWFNRDHTSVLHGVKVHRSKIEKAEIK